jgi:hypothetical protein
LFERGANTVRIGRSGDSHAHASDLDIDHAGVPFTYRRCAPVAILTGVHDSNWYKLGPTPGLIEETLLIQLSPMKDLVGIDAVRSRDHRNGCPWHECLFNDLPALELGSVAALLAIHQNCRTTFDGVWIVLHFPFGRPLTAYSEDAVSRRG